YYTLAIRDLATGKDTGETLENLAGGAIWSHDSRALYYTEYDENHRPFRVRRHVLGTPQADDEIIYEETDPGFFVGVSKTLSDRFIVIDAHDHQTSENWLIDAIAGGPPRLVAARKVDREYEVEEADGILYIRTNEGNAE